MSDDPSSTSVTGDRLCLRCGYNLRGLPLAGNCPECGEAVQHSLRGNLLKYADRKWLDRLRFGAALKLWNILLMVTGGIAGSTVVAVLNLPEQVLAILMAAAGAFGLWASFVITTQEPRVAMQEDPVNWRKTIRICATVAFIGTIAGEAGRSVQAITITGSVLSLTGVVALFGELVYFRRFALRIPNEKLARQTHTVMWGTAIVLGLVVLAGIGIALIVATTAGAATLPGGTIRSSVTATGATVNATGGLAIVLAGSFCVLAIPALVFFIWYVVLLFRYRAEFATAATPIARPVNSRSPS